MHVQQGLATTPCADLPEMFPLQTFPRLLQ